MKKTRFSKDPKVKLISIENFFSDVDYLYDINEEDFINNKTCFEPFKTYYKFTEKYLISVFCGYSIINYGTDIREKVEEIKVSYRDGKSEYDLFDKALLQLKEERNKYKRNKKLDKKIEQVEKLKARLPKYKSENKLKQNPFESYLKDTGYKTTIDNLKNKYIVFDVETNGLRKSNDDLLSLSIYDPTTGVCYNRFLPLDLQPLVLTTSIHGITDKTLAKETHMTQEELDWLYDYFKLKDKILLSFSGGKGTFDLEFILNYFQRQGIEGFKDLKFENIKNKIPPVPFGCEGQLTKDNLCRILGVDGVKKLHSSYNDCILQWKLFEKLESEIVFFIEESLYKYHPEYIIPYSYLYRHPDLIKRAGINVPNVMAKPEEIKRLSFPKSLLKEIKKFPTNITGITIEHGINSYLKAEKQDNLEFLIKNKTHLEYLGCLDSRVRKIPIIKEKDGTVVSIDPEYNEFIKNVNDVTSKIIEHIKPIADYLKNEIFTDGKIMTQELAYSKDKKVLALCDLSDNKNIVEIKTYDILSGNERIRNELARQLYFQSNGRNTYVLSIKFDTSYSEKEGSRVVDNLNVILYKVDLFEYDPSTVIHERILSEDEVKALKMIEKSPSTTKKFLSYFYHRSIARVNIILDNLEKFGYIAKDKVIANRVYWKVIRTHEDKITKYKILGDTINIIN